MKNSLYLPLFCLALGIIGCERKPTEASRPVQLLLPADATTQERQFLEHVRDAILTTNITALVAMEHVRTGKLSEDFHRSMIDRGYFNLELERVDPTKETEHKMRDGTLIRESLPVRWIVKVRHPPIGPNAGNASTSLKAGLHDGQIRFTQAQAAK